MKIQPQRRAPLDRMREPDPIHPPLHEDPSIHDDPPVDWGAPSAFPNIPARPGMAQKWVRTHIGPDGDEMNVQKNLSQGWKPRMADTIKDYTQPKLYGARFEGAASIPGMVLMEMPEELYAQKVAYHANRTKMLSEAVDRDILRVQSDRVPFTQTRTGRTQTGKRAHIADDDD